MAGNKLYYIHHYAVEKKKKKISYAVTDYQAPCHQFLNSSLSTSNFFCISHQHF